MPAPLVKICGLRHLEDLQLAAESGADLLGIILAPSKRLVNLETAQSMGRWLRQYRGDTETSPGTEGAPPAGADAAVTWFQDRAAELTRRRGPLLVGVFLDQPVDYIREVAAQIPLDLVQLHGREDIHLAADIGHPVIKVFHMDETFSDYATVATPGYHRVSLLDAKVAGPASAQGGRGVTFDWSLTDPVRRAGQPFILAGGLNPRNVAQAVASATPWAVDVSSGVERDDGSLRKCPDKVREFITSAKASLVA
ncbi:anthranilate synthase / indole-3-glycerol phosphate synthase [Tieghemiomyces parasiticus]|uniref:N-(5'-phosphoribosyl)anthranilate isomerase n=1 Tax=Tieghemiomyces parasiticus TaxID=78921 RepID=A0A9W8E0E6_9FUNG|nr:anthranilate synthase / indole-3-glycerol phosphate synthase [Tieghemiomyces parasiticus]